MKNLTQDNSSQSLAERLAMKQAEDRLRAEELTLNELKRLEENFQKLSIAALDSIKSVTEKASADMDILMYGRRDKEGKWRGGVLPVLSSRASKISKEFENQQMKMDEEIRKQTKRMLWILQIPVLATLSLCLLILLVTWVWMPTELFSANTVRVNYPKGQFLVITDPSWTVCQQEINGSWQPCKLIEPAAH